jgi:hypothetical protein
MLGLVMAELEEPESGQVVPLAARSLVGRAATCTVRLTDPRVSGEHAVLHVSDSAWEVRDLGSRNGTFVDGERLPSGGRRDLKAGSRLSFGGPPGPGTTSWRLADAAPPDQHPAGEASTMFADEPLDLVRLTLRFTVSADEEHVQVHLRQEGHADRALPARAFHYVLLTLARARLEDAARDPPAPSEHGWRYADELARCLGMEVERMNVDIFRARKQLTDLGVANAATVVERRPTTHQLRIGTARIEIA